MTAGDTAVLPCPIRPGALVQYYSVMWKKNNTLILSKRMNRVVKTNSKYDISTVFSLVIDSVDVNDTSFSYECIVHHEIPATNVRQKLQPCPNRDIRLSLQVLGMLYLYVYNSFSYYLARS